MICRLCTGLSRSTMKENALFSFSKQVQWCLLPLMAHLLGLGHTGLKYRGFPPFPAIPTFLVNLLQPETDDDGDTDEAATKSGMLTGIIVAPLSSDLQP